jgi:hypothetical protein
MQGAARLTALRARACATRTRAVIRPGNALLAHVHCAAR